MEGNGRGLKVSFHSACQGNTTRRKVADLREKDRNPGHLECEGRRGVDPLDDYIVVVVTCI